MCIKLVKMTTSETYRLTHPELLSERELCEILKDSCIDISDFKNLCKAELLEIYNRVALPLPGRREENCTDSKDGTQKENPEKTVERQKIEKMIPSNENGKRNCQNVDQDRVKLPIQEYKSLNKKIRLFNVSKPDTVSNSISKRTMDIKSEDANIPPAKKRQKITWP